MSTQSIKVTDRLSYQKEFEKNILDFSEKWWYSEKFLLGKKTDRDEMRHTILFHRLLCTNSCEMSDFIFNRINGLLTEKCEKKSGLKKIIECYKKETHKEHCSDTEVVNDCCTTQINW